MRLSLLLMLHIDVNFFLIHNISGRVEHTEDVKECMHWLAILISGGVSPPYLHQMELI